MDPKLGRPRIPPGRDSQPPNPLPMTENKRDLSALRADQAAASSVLENHGTMNLGVTTGAYNGAEIYDQAPGSASTSSSDGESLNNHNENKTPPPERSPDRESVGSVSVTQLGRLSLDQQQPPQSRPPRPKQATRKNVSPTASMPSATSGKRNCPTEPSVFTEGQGLSSADQGLDCSSTDNTHSPECKRPRGNHVTVSPKRPQATSRHIRGQSRGQAPHPALGRPSPYNYQQQRPRFRKPGSQTVFESPHLPSVSSETSSHDGSIPLPSIGAYSKKYPGLILQPTSSPISKEQLAAEVKGIYSGLVMVEAKCINIDAAQAADPDSQLSPDQWQALIALHRTLLYEHHDFLMATQHPSATPALRNLAQKYSMPARMWRHGIHSFLEVLRFRRPQSQDYMLAFIYLAYQMVALLYETVPIFTDTWIECLGDLARYRMAIEENREQHAIWGNVAGRWYHTASDRHPEIGRLYHHLGILERPSVRKFYLYTKSLTCTVPFPNAKDSLSTLCTPIVESSSHYYTGDRSAEAGLVTFHALVYSNYGATTIMEAGSEALSRLAVTPALKVKDFGVELVISNVGALFELGSARNNLWQRFNKAIHKEIQQSRPSSEASTPPNTILSETEKQLMTLSSSEAPSFVTGFVYSAFETLIRLGKDRNSVRDMLPTVHTILIWFYSLHSLDSRQTEDDDQDSNVDDLERNNTSSSLPEIFSWGALATFLNLLTQYEPIGARTLQFARQGMFLLPERSEIAAPAINEDYTMRGLVWTPSFYPQGWFSTQPNDGSREIETSATHKARFERVHWLALYLAFRIEPLKFDMEKRVFYASGRPVSASSEFPREIPVEAKPQGQDQQPDQQESIKSNNGSGSSSTPSAHSDEEGHVVVTKKSKPVQGSSWAAVASRAPSKKTVDNAAVQILGQDDNVSMQWEPAR